MVEEYKHFNASKLTSRAHSRSTSKWQISERLGSYSFKTRWIKPFRIWEKLWWQVWAWSTPSKLHNIHEWGRLSMQLVKKKFNPTLCWFLFDIWINDNSISEVLILKFIIFLSLESKHYVISRMWLLIKQLCIVQDPIKFWNF